MATVTIPKELTKAKDLVAVPRSTYEEFLSWQRQVKGARTFRATAAEKKTLAAARKNFKRGKYLTLKQLQHALGRRR